MEMPTAEPNEMTSRVRTTEPWKNARPNMPSTRGFAAFRHACGDKERTEASVRQSFAPIQKRSWRLMGISLVIADRRPLLSCGPI
jgi:hypothetical protein